MLRLLFGIFVTLHGLVHLWYVALSQGLVESEPDVGWTGESRLLSGLLSDAVTGPLAGGLFGVATAAFVVSGIGVLARAEWRRSILLGSAIFSTASLLLYWDGTREMIVQKGLIAFLINAGIMIVVLLADWP